MKRERLFYLDLIRVISMLLIVIYHFPLPLYIGGTDVLHSTANSRWGVAGVYVFFMISGAALFRRYRHRDSFSLISYYKRRISSLYPLFYVAYVLGFMYVFWVRGSMYSYVPTRAFLWTILGLDGYLNSIVPTFTMVGEWFLGAIIIVYALFPLVYHVVMKKDEGMEPRRSLMLMALLFCGTLAVYIFHPLKLIEIKADPVVDLSFFLLGACISELWGERLAYGGLRIPGLLVSGLMLLAWCFIKLPFGTALSTDGLPLYLTESVAAVCIFVFMTALSGYLEALPTLKRIIGRASGYTYGVFLIHHLVESQICAHFDTDAFSRRDTAILLMLCLLAVIIFTALIYRIRDILGRMLS